LSARRKEGAIEYVIRQAEQQDLAAITACVQAAYSKYVERIGKKPAPMMADYPALIARGVTYTVVDGADVLGTLVMEPQDGAMLVDNVAVDPRFQGRGLGRALMAFAEQQARDQGLDMILLYTNEAMTENLIFYQRLGFEEESRNEQDGYCRVFLRKRLG
jgi:ribosomal protein S18 acetylase RimI-like enzyme